MIQTAVLGCGNIGSGVVQVIEENQEQIRKTLPEGMNVKYILDLRDFPGTSFEHKVVHDLDVILSDPEITIACETMGGKEPAFTFTKRLLERGISVCSSNKELVEAFGPELLRIAAEHNCSYLFEASVGGGIPLLHPLITCLAQDEIESIQGILNGTTNYILTKMEHFGEDYAGALAQAQELGYAERDPRADVEGHDTGRKIAILASLMCGKRVRYEDENVEGIKYISAEDFAYASANGYTIRLLGIAKRRGEHLQVLTAPFLVPKGHPLYSVSDVFNAVLVRGNMAGDLMFYGRGAGKLPTASAVVSDMINSAKSAGKTLPVRWDAQVLPIDSPELSEYPFFVRMSAKKAKEAQEVFGGRIEKVWTGAEEEFAFITGTMTEGALHDDLAILGGALQVIRVLA